MNTFLTLLRRTAVALGAIAALTVTSEANAQAGTINLSNGSSCEYSSMTIAPDGSVSVQCGTTTPPAGAGTFIILANVSNLSTGVANSGTAFAVKRSGGTSGDVVVSYTVTPSATGVCAAAGSGSLTFASGSTTTTQYIPVSTGTIAGTCKVDIDVGTPGIPGSTLTKTLPVSAPVAGCPVNDTPVLNLLGSGTTSLGAKIMPSGVVASYRLPATSTNSGQFILSNGANAAPVAPWSYEITISKCKGSMTEGMTGPGCTIAKSTMASLLTQVWMLNPAGRYLTQEQMDAKQICHTPGGGSTTVPKTVDYYINIRYTYAGCTSAGGCGWVPQWTKYTY